MEMENEARLGSQGAGTGFRIISLFCLLRAPAEILVLQGLESWLGGQAGLGHGLCFLLPRFEIDKPKFSGMELFPG